MRNISVDTFSLVLFRAGSFVRQFTGLDRGEALDDGMQAVRDGEADRFEVWNEYTDTIEITG